VHRRARRAEFVVPAIRSTWSGDRSMTPTVRRPPIISASPVAGSSTDRVSYDRRVAHASPSPTPNPDAMKFTLDTTLPATLNVTSADDASGHRFAEAVFAAGGVAAIYGVNDFITVTRQPGFDWEPIVAAVIAAAESDL
jgi:Scaffold protein Nfu/NifU N terminal